MTPDTFANEIRPESSIGASDVNKFWDTLPVESLSQEGLEGEIACVIQLIEAAKIARDLPAIIRLTNLLADLKTKREKLPSDAITPVEVRKFLRGVFSILKSRLLEDDYQRVMSEIERRCPVPNDKNEE